MYAYDRDFYSYLASFALQSARRVVGRLSSALPVASIADFGCGQGAWLRAWSETGASILGVDGPYIERDRLMIDAADFRAADLGERVELGRRFDLVQSLEVAEHLPASKAAGFVETLVSHAPLVLFSAAMPGQGGENHVNEQPLSYWRALFRERGYVAVDYLRPLIAEDAAIQPWYRYNMLLYAGEGAVAALPGALRECVVPDAEELADYRPFAYRLRQAIVRQLPGPAVNRISRLRARF
jgi:SAM-dependent methyltransferase